jgi:hypothetical protein
MGSRLVGAAAPTALVALLFSPPTAHADDTDAKYLPVLAGAGIHGTNGDDTVLINAAHQVGAKRASGVTEHAAINDVMTGSNVDSFTGFEVVGAAELNYCPQYYATFHPGDQ